MNRLKGAWAVAVVAVLATLLTGCAVYRPTGSWGVYEENAFLGSCELRAGTAKCTCLLGYLEQNYSEAQIAADYQAGTITSDMQPGVNACEWALL
jgi:hypothetical protein